MKNSSLIEMDVQETYKKTDRVRVSAKNDKIFRRS